MNPLLSANLSRQRKFLESGSAYRTERVALNAVFAVVGVFGLVAAYTWSRLVGGIVFSAGVGVWPDDVVYANRVLLIVFVLMHVGVTYLMWALARAFFDIADASIASTMQEPVTPKVLGGSVPKPSQGASKWPEPPTPLIPVPEAIRPEDGKYMPKG